MTRSQDNSVNAVTGLWIHFLAGAGHFSLLQNVQAVSEAYPPGLLSQGVKPVGHGALCLQPTSAFVRNEQSCISVHHHVPSWCQQIQHYLVSYLCDTSAICAQL
jgi:hypothetical protein